MSFASWFLKAMVSDATGRENTEHQAFFHLADFPGPQAVFQSRGERWNTLFRIKTSSVEKGVLGCDSCSWEGRLKDEFKASLSYKKPCLKTFKTTAVYVALLWIACLASWVVGSPWVPS